MWKKLKAKLPNRLVSCLPSRATVKPLSPTTTAVSRYPRD
jgi:hypothetical protein